MMGNSFYFQHDYNAANDHKILFLRQQFGIEGYGIYFYILEQLAQANGKLPLKIVPVLAMQIQTTPDKVGAVISNYDLFIIDQDKNFFSSRLMEQIEFRNKLSDSGRKGGLRSGELRKLKAFEAPLEAPLEARKGKERKGKKEKEINTRDIFLPFPSKEFSDAWEEWIQYRRERKNKITPMSAKKQLGMLSKKSESEAIEMINQSIRNSWTGIFETTKKSTEVVNRLKFH